MNTERLILENRSYADINPMYQEDVQTFEPLSREEELRLAGVIQQGIYPPSDKSEQEDKQHKKHLDSYSLTNEAKRAFESLVCSNLGLVLPLAQKYATNGLPLEDLIQEGNFGLMNAAHTYKPDTKFRFSWYAKLRILSSIQHAIANQGNTIRIPVYSYDRLNLIENTASLSSQASEDYESSEIHELIPQLSTAQIKKTIQSVPLTHTESFEELEHATSESNDPSIENTDIRSDERSVEEQVLFNEFIKKTHGLLHICDSQGKQILTDREMDIVTKYWGLEGEEPIIFKDIAVTYHITAARIQQIYNTALYKLEKYIYRSPDLKEIYRDYLRSYWQRERINGKITTLFGFY